MKKILPFLTLLFALLIAGSSIAADTVAKINFCDADTEQEGWTSVFGTKSTYPLDLGNGMTLVKVDYSTPHMGDSYLDDVGIELDNFPPTVINSCNYLANTDNAYTIGMKITGLNPNEEYTFDIYSRAWGTTEKITKFSVGDSDTITVVSTLNEEVIYFTDLQPDANGEITLDVTKLPGGYAFINGWIITKQEETTEPPVMTGDTVAKINFCDADTEQEGWTSVFGTKSTYPIDLGSGMTLVKVDYSTPHMGDSYLDDIGAEIEGFPYNVQNSANYLANTDNAYTIGMKITGLDPGTKYTFDIYSRAWGTTEKISKFSVGDSDTITVVSTMNEEVIYFTDLQPDANGELTLDITKLAGGYAFINGWIITKQEETTEPPVMTGDTVAKINFCDADTEQEGWTSVFGTKSTYPIDLGSGMTLVKVDYSTPHMGDSYLDDIGAEIEGFPYNVQNSANYLANTDNAYTIGMKITGLDPGTKYTFDIYSRAWGTTEKISKFSVGDSDTITVVSTMNEEVIYFTDLQPDANGELTLDITKLPGGYAFINGWIITKQEETTEPPVMTGDTVAKINFCDADTEQEGWTSVFGTKSTYPIDLGSGMTLVKVDYSTPHMGDSYLDDIGAEIEGFPYNVQNSANYLANTDNAYTIGMKITGLDPGTKYTFDIYSRAWGTTEKISKFSVGDSDTITVVSTMNEEVIYFTDLQPDANGELTLDITKLAGGYAFINGWIITKQISDNVRKINSSNIKLYPNPASDYVQIDNLETNSTISVFNIAGKKMIEKTNGFDSRTMVDMKNLKNGIYLIRVMDLNTTSRTFKVIKK